MFTLPPRAPKDYFLKTVPKGQASAPEHTPSALPRATQTTLAKYCYPIPADDNEPADKSSIEELNDRVLDMWANAARPWWVDPPNANGFFLQDVFKKYSVLVDPDYDPRYKNRPRLFQRPYTYEMDCLKAAQRHKLWEKTRREDEEESMKQEQRMQEQQANEKQVGSCKSAPPFWWKTFPAEVIDGERSNRKASNKTTYQASYIRWQTKPSLFEASQSDPCKRREAFAKFGQPFEHEACTWYFKNYPPPAIKFIPEKFG